MQYERWALVLGLAAGLAAGAVPAATTPASAPPPADTAYRNGFIYTVDAEDSVQQALAIRAGRFPGGRRCAHRLRKRLAGGCAR